MEYEDYEEYEDDDEEYVEETQMYFHRNFVDFWMGWWVLIYMIPFALHLTFIENPFSAAGEHFGGGFLLILSSIGYFIWIRNAIGVVKHFVHWAILAICTVFCGVLASMTASRQIFKGLTEFFDSAKAGSGDSSNIFLLLAILYFIAFIGIPLAAFAYTKWYLYENDLYVDDNPWVLE